MKTQQTLEFFKEKLFHTPLLSQIIKVTDSLAPSITILGIITNSLETLNIYKLINFSPSLKADLFSHFWLIVNCLENSFTICCSCFSSFLLLAIKRFSFAVYNRNNNIAQVGIFPHYLKLPFLEKIALLLWNNNVICVLLCIIFSFSYVEQN